MSVRRAVQLKSENVGIGKNSKTAFAQLPTRGTKIPRARNAALRDVTNKTATLVPRKTTKITSSNTAKEQKDVQSSFAVRQPLADISVEKADGVVQPVPAVAFTELFDIDNIDAQDHGNPQLCAEYVQDIYHYMRELERKFEVPRSFLSNQRDITSSMRAVLVDWLIQVQHRFKLLQETLYVTISILDRFLQKSKSISRNKLQLVGVTSMLIASKYEETYAPEVMDFVYITDNAYTAAQIREMEGTILNVLQFELGRPFCLQFLRRNSKAGDADATLHTAAKYLMELTLPEIEMVPFLPSQIAAAALYLSMRLFGRGSWTRILQHYSGCSEAELLPCARKMAALLQKAASDKKLTAVRSKYESGKFMQISKVAELQPPVIEQLLRHL